MVCGGLPVWDEDMYILHRPRKSFVIQQGQRGLMGRWGRGEIWRGGSRRNELNI